MRASLNSSRVCTLQRGNVTRPARFLQTSCRRRRTTQRRGCRRVQTPPWRWALAQHRTPFSQPGRTRQRASRATLTGGTARAATLGIFTTAPPAQSHGHLRPGRWSPVSLRRDSRPSRGSAALALPTRGFSADDGVCGEDVDGRLHVLVAGIHRHADARRTGYGDRPPKRA